MLYSSRSHKKYILYLISSNIFQGINMGRPTSPLTIHMPPTYLPTIAWPLDHLKLDVVDSLSGISCQAKTLKSAFRGDLLRDQPQANENPSTYLFIYSIHSNPVRSDRWQIERYSNCGWGGTWELRRALNLILWKYKPKEWNRLLLYHHCLPFFNGRWICSPMHSQWMNGWVAGITSTARIRRRLGNSFSSHSA